jgi:hypothetical protein
VSISELPLTDTNLTDKTPQVSDLAASDRLRDLQHSRSPRDIDANEVSRLLSDVVRLYAAMSEERDTMPPPSQIKVTATEAVVVAAALLRSQRLTPFEFAIWYDGGPSTAR